MKPHRILKSFPGNQTGIGETEYFEEGTVRDLSDHLAAVAVPAGLAEPAGELPALDTATATPATRETKVLEPEETKPEKPVAKKGKK